MEPDTRVATIESAHAEELLEALAAVGIEARVVPVVPMTQVAVVRNNYRPMADVLVAAAREAEARAILATWESQGEAAAEAEAENPSPADSSTDAKAVTRVEAEERPRALGLAVLLGLVGLTLVSVIVFGFDQALGVLAERYPVAFPVAGMLVLGGVFLLLRRRR